MRQSLHDCRHRRAQRARSPRRAGHDRHPARSPRAARARKRARACADAESSARLVACARRRRAGCRDRACAAHSETRARGRSWRSIAEQRVEQRARLERGLDLRHGVDEIGLIAHNRPARCGRATRSATSRVSAASRALRSPLAPALRDRRRLLPSAMYARDELQTAAHRRSRLPAAPRRAGGAGAGACASRVAAFRSSSASRSCFVGVLEARPPFADRRIDFAARAAQQQEIVARAKARILEQPVRPPAAALQKRGCITQISFMSAP